MPPLAGAVLLLLLLVPALRHALEASMTAQMLVQLPLLALAGWLGANGLPERWRDRSARWNVQGITGLVLATAASAYWMLPRALDAAAASASVDAAKYVSVPLLIGLPLALSGPRMGFVVAGVFVTESIATAFRLGWLYSASPERLCSRYLLDDQQRLGAALLVLGCVLFVAVAVKLLWGRFDLSAGRQHAARYHDEPCN